MFPSCTEMASEEMNSVEGAAQGDEKALTEGGAQRDEKVLTEGGAQRDEKALTEGGAQRDEKVLTEGGAQRDEMVLTEGGAQRDEKVLTHSFKSCGINSQKQDSDDTSCNTRHEKDGEPNACSMTQKFYDSLKRQDSDFESLSSVISNTGVDVNHVFTEQFIELPYRGWTALHFVCKRDGHLMLKYLLSLGADPNLETKKGESPLHIASKHGHYRCVEILLEHDNTLKNKQNIQGLTPLMKAVYRSDTSFKENNYRKTIKALMQSGCNVNLSPPSNMTPLHVVAGKWHSTALLKSLIKAGADVNASTGSSSPLMTALCRQRVNTETVIALIDSGADVNYRNEYGKSLLHVAVAKSEDICVKHLLQAGAEVNVLDSDGNSPLWIAVADNNAKIATMLLERGSDVNFTNRDYHMSLLCKSACDKNNTLFQLLLDHGANVNESTKLGAPPLHYAVDNGDMQKVKLLLSKNCALDDYSAFKNLYCPMNAFQIALRQGNEEMVKLLLRAGLPLDKHQIQLDRLPKAVREQEELIEWIYNYLYSPRTLKHLCCLQLRSLYGAGILKVVENLVSESFIPQRVADAILLKDLLQRERSAYDSLYDTFDDFPAY